MSTPDDIVILGAGHAAAQLCASLVEAGLGARLVLVGEEGRLPYQRPPLSKAYLKSPAESLQWLRSEAWLQEAGVRTHLGDAAVAIDRAARTVRLHSGTVLPYGHLILATGARARQLPGLPAGAPNVATLRDAADADRLRALIGGAARLTVLGGGFIGLEIAATALSLGKPVRLLEGAPRLMGRAVSPALSDHVLAVHRAAGLDVRLGARIGAIGVEGGRVATIEVDGQAEPVELLLMAIGARPETALAEAAGLPCEDGVLVDAHMRTADPAILAIGDCTRFPEHGSSRRLRLESVQNANDQARTAAATILGQPRPHAAMPWFWSDQGALRLQMTGLMPAADTRGLATLRRPGPNAAAFSLLHYVGERFACIESVNAPADHIVGRKLLEAGRSPPAAAAVDPAVPLKSHLA